MGYVSIIRLMNGISSGQKQSGQMNVGDFFWFNLRLAGYDYYSSFLLPLRIMSLMVGSGRFLPPDESKLDLSRKFQFAERFWVLEFLAGDLGFYLLIPYLSEGISFWEPNFTC